MDIDGKTTQTLTILHLSKPSSELPNPQHQPPAPRPTTKKTPHMSGIFGFSKVRPHFEGKVRHLNH